MRGAPQQTTFLGCTWYITVLYTRYRFIPYKTKGFPQKRGLHMSLDKRGSGKKGVRVYMKKRRGSRWRTSSPVACIMYIYIINISKGFPNKEGDLLGVFRQRARGFTWLYCTRYHILGVRAGPSAPMTEGHNLGVTD